jgi:glycosyltransferase involved in cell wall biosynthesis
MTFLEDIGTVAVDARMIRHSGIGVVLQSLLQYWHTAGGPRICLLGEPGLLKEMVPASTEAEIIRWVPPIYSPTAALAPPGLPKDVRVWFGPHYATCLRPPVPLVCHIHDVLHIIHPTRRGTRLFMHACLQMLRRRASYVTTPSRHVKVQLQTLYGFAPDRVLIASNGAGVLESLDPGTYQQLPELSNRPYLVAVGILKPHKNWPFLLRRLVAMREIDLPLVCLGLGKDRSRLIELATELGIAERLIVPARLEPEQVAGVLAGARALLFPSLAEGFGLPVLEAMSVGTPVVMAARSPMKEIAAGSACMFDPDWPETFDDALREALREGPERGKRIELGRRRAQDFSWKRTAHHIEDALYRAATGELPPVREQTPYLLGPFTEA